MFEGLEIDSLGVLILSRIGGSKEKFLEMFE